MTCLECSSRWVPLLTKQTNKLLHCCYKIWNFVYRSFELFLSIYPKTLRNLPIFKYLSSFFLGNVSLLFHLKGFIVFQFIYDQRWEDYSWFVGRIFSNLVFAKDTSLNSYIMPYLTVAIIIYNTLHLSRLKLPSVSLVIESISLVLVN